jgi:hypothetical protein
VSTIRILGLITWGPVHGSLGDIHDHESFINMTFMERCWEGLNLTWMKSTMWLAY